MFIFRDGIETRKQKSRGGKVAKLSLLAFASRCHLNLLRYRKKKEIRRTRTSTVKPWRLNVDLDSYVVNS